MLSQTELKHLIAGFPDELPRTRALEQRIRIGTGFHGKWYRSQREHWLGWIALAEQAQRAKGEDPNGVAAKKRWSNLGCAPMMFWLAEAAGVFDAALSQAERNAETAADASRVDGPAHGKAIRAAIAWTEIEARLSCLPRPNERARSAAEATSEAARARLVAFNPKYA